jgi:hypothetical protein
VLTDLGVHCFESGGSPRAEAWDAGVEGREENAGEVVVLEAG